MKPESSLITYFQDSLESFAETRMQPDTVNFSQRILIIDKLHHTSLAVNWVNPWIEKMGGKIPIIEPLEGHTTGNEQWNPLMLKIIMMWHDSGAIDEAILHRKGNHNNNGFDQSDEGAKLFRETFDLDYSSAYLTAQKGIDYEIVTDAIGNHGKKEYKGTNPYALAARDLDKLTVVKRVFDSEEWNVKLQNLVYDNNQINGLTPKALNSFLEKGIVANEEVKTVSDWILKTIGWRMDLNFTPSKEIWDEQIIKKQIKDLKKYYLQENNLDPKTRLKREIEISQIIAKLQDSEVKI